MEGQPLHFDFYKTTDIFHETWPWIMRPSQATLRMRHKFDEHSALKFNKKGTWTCVSHVPTLRLWNAVREDNETTSPRIYVNRRTPPCSF